MMRTGKWYLLAWLAAMATLAVMAWCFDGEPSSYRFFGMLAAVLTGVSVVVGCLEKAWDQ